jgi:hypothetical protein
MGSSSRLRVLGATAVAAVLLAAGGGNALADNVYNSLDGTVDASVETLTVAPNATATVTLGIDSTNGDGKNGCNLTGSTTLVAAVSSSNTSLATVSPGSVTFDACGATRTLTVTGRAAGTARISLALTSNNSGGTFDLAPATFDVTVSATKSATTTRVTCSDVTYTGTALTPCSGATTGDAFSATPALVYAANTDAGTGSVTATFAGDATHLASSATATFAIARASSSTSVVCTDVTYTGGPLTPCTATATGVPDVSVPLSVDYSGTNTDAGTASATASWAGDANHDGSSGSQTFRIGQAAASCRVTPYSGVYDGQPHGLSGTCIGVGGVDLSAGLTLGETRTDAGSSTVPWSFEGGANYADQAGTSSITIERAPSATTVTCPTTTSAYTGTAQEPCTARVTGGGGLDAALVPAYLSNVHPGTAAVSASFDGGANWLPSTGSGSFSIVKAATTTTVTCPAGPYGYTGAGQTPCSATVSGPALSQPVAVTYTNNQDAGTARAEAVYPGDEDHWASSGSGAFTIDQAPSTVTITCSSATYTGSPIRTCSATAQGAGGLSVPLTLTYANNVAAGTATASAVYTGDRNHVGTSGSQDFVIGKAESHVALTCATSAVYSGATRTPCTATATGAGNLLVDLTADVAYTDNVDTGTAHASVVYAGDDNHLGDHASTTFEIVRAASLTAVSCPTSVVYDGSLQTPCTAGVTGDGGLAQELPVSYENSTDAGTATASAAFAGDRNHDPSADSKTFVIEKAPSLVTLTCDPSVEYDGTAQHPCSASVTGAGGLSLPLSVAFLGNVGVGTATATASFAGDANHTGDTRTVTFEITPAPSVVTVTCPETVTYTGDALTPCSATATGAGGLSQPLTVTYGSNTAAGSATASAMYAGDVNHTGSSADTTFGIAKAPVTVAVTCPSSVVFSGAAQTPCTARVTGAGGLSVPAEVAYGANVHAGAVTASAAYDGDANHLAGSGSGSFTIAKASSTTTVTCPAGPYYYTGSPLTPACTARATGVGSLDVAVTPVTFSANTAVGPATASATYAGDADHTGSTGSTTFTISAWTLRGFYQPVDMGGTVNTVKAGSTVPLKFEVFSGSTELTDVSAVSSFSVKGISCASTATDAIELTTTGGTSLRYDTTGGQFIQNWQTPKSVGSCYKVTMTTQDGSSIEALFKLK